MYKLTELCFHSLHFQLSDTHFWMHKEMRKKLSAVLVNSFVEKHSSLLSGQGCTSGMGSTKPSRVSNYSAVPVNSFDEKYGLHTRRKLKKFTWYDTSCVPRCSLFQLTKPFEIDLAAMSLLNK